MKAPNHYTAETSFADLEEELTNRIAWTGAMAMLVRVDGFSDWSDEIRESYSAAMRHLLEEASEIKDLMYDRLQGKEAQKKALREGEFLI